MTALPIAYPAAWRPWIEAFLAVPTFQWKFGASLFGLGIFFWCALISLGGKIGQSDPSYPAWRQWIHTLRWPIANLSFILCLWTGFQSISGFPPAFFELKSLGLHIALACVAAGAAIRSANILTLFFQRRFFPEKFAEDAEIALITTRLLRGLILLIAALEASCCTVVPSPSSGYRPNGTVPAISRQSTCSSMATASFRSTRATRRRPRTSWASDATRS